MKRKIAYSLISAIPVVAGLTAIVGDVREQCLNCYFRGFDAIAGLALLQLGILNLLSALYGSSNTGIRFAAAAIDVLSIGLTLQMIYWATQRGWDTKLPLLQLGIAITMAMFSVVPFKGSGSK